MFTGPFTQISVQKTPNQAKPPNNANNPSKFILSTAITSWHISWLVDGVSMT